MYLFRFSFYFLFLRIHSGNQTGIESLGGRSTEYSLRCPCAAETKLVMMPNPSQDAFAWSFW